MSARVSGNPGIAKSRRRRIRRVSDSCYPIRSCDKTPGRQSVEFIAVSHDSENRDMTKQHEHFPIVFVARSVSC